jgi:hypothetical protein
VIVKKLVLVLVAVVLAILFVEGVLSLATGRSLRPSAFDEVAIPEGAARPVSRMGKTGFGQYHIDPRVNYQVRTGTRIAMEGISFEYERDGWRKRERPPREGAMRIVVLGDSVVFGAGLDDHETIAAQLEVMLDGFTARDGRVVDAFTVAAPGWNHSNAVHFLLDDVDRIAPDVVVYLPVDNDIADSYVRQYDDEFGPGFDPLAEDPLLSCSMEATYGRVIALAKEARDGNVRSRLMPGQLGPVAIAADLSRESTRRFDANAASVAKLETRLAGRGIPLYLMPYVESGAIPSYHPLLRERLSKLRVAAPTIPGFSSYHESFTRQGDPHPSAIGTHAMAVWIAQRLVADGLLVATGGASLPAIAEELVKLRAPAVAPEDIAGDAESWRVRARELLQSEIDVTTGLGCYQLFGGLFPDGAIGPRLLAMLKPGGPRLRVTIGPLQRKTHDVVIDLTVAVDGVVVGSLQANLGPGAEPSQATFDLPPDATRREAIEVEIRADDWVLHPIFGERVVASCSLLELVCRD